MKALVLGATGAIAPLKTKRDRRRNSANGPAHNNNNRIT